MLLPDDLRGGYVSACTVAAAAAVLAEVARASRESWQGASAAAAQATALRERASSLAPADARAFAEVLEARGLPADLDPEERDDAIGAALEQAAELPLRIAAAAADVAELGVLIAGCCEQEVRGDAICGVLLAEGAARAAASLIDINLATREGDPRQMAAGRLIASAGAASRRAATPGP